MIKKGEQNAFVFLFIYFVLNKFWGGSFGGRMLQARETDMEGLGAEKD